MFMNEILEELVEVTEDPDDPKPPKKKGNGVLTVAIMGIVICGLVIFSGIQALYIFRLNTGRTGVMDYLSDQTEKDEDVTEVSHRDTDELPEPWFTLEEAASVSDPNKTRLNVTEIVDKVSPATVSLYIKGKINGADKTVSSGSGFIITPDGYAVSNAHVVEDAKNNAGYKLYASITGSDVLIPCEIVGLDTQTDCAVIKLQDDRTYDYVTLGNSSDLRTGELVVAIGNALGTLDGTVTCGVVSALSRQMSHEGYKISVLQTDAAINSGNSGGALINSFGEVIGIVNAKMVVNSSEGLGFAIPIDTVKPVIESLINYGKVVNRAFLGVTVISVPADAYGGAVEGVYVYEYVDGGPADQAGLQIGDRIISIDGVAINQTDDIIGVRDSHQVGDTVIFAIERNGQKMEIKFVIGDSADYEDADTVTSETESDSEGSTDDNSGDDEKENIFGGH